MRANAAATNVFRLRRAALAAIAHAAASKTVVPKVAKIVWQSGTVESMSGATRKAAATHARPTLRRFGRLTCASVGIKRMQNATRAMTIKGDALKASLVC